METREPAFDVLRRDAQVSSEPINRLADVSQAVCARNKMQVEPRFGWRAPDRECRTGRRSTHALAYGVATIISSSPVISPRMERAVETCRAFESGERLGGLKRFGTVGMLRRAPRGSLIGFSMRCKDAPGSCRRMR
jgi:hypothetical protein